MFPNPRRSQGVLFKPLITLALALCLALWLQLPWDETPHSAVPPLENLSESIQEGRPGGIPRNLAPSSEVLRKLPRDGGPEFNRLVFERSPYLLQHSRNPVDWFPWGPEAFEKARQEDKPIFLSLGYSTCHWCHVMEHESFEHPEVAALLNEFYVAIKVDREERPDLDEIYMNATQIFTGQGGWPNSVWLTPEAKPWFAGTYFPRDRFLNLLGKLAQAWKEKRPSIEKQAEAFRIRIQKIAGGADQTATQEDLDQLRESYFLQLSRGLASRFDKVHGGFGGAPKFPPHHSLLLLLDELQQRPDLDCRKMVTTTLDAMLAGGIHDHVGGGFHRYSTDLRWFLPHFEKMLYDNALLGRALVEAWQVTGEIRYQEAARGVFDWILRDMTDPRTGGFFSALDADSPGGEGLFYLWTPGQLEEILSSDQATLFASVYQVTTAGNLQGRGDEFPAGSSLPFLRGTLEEFARSQELSSEGLREQMAAAHSRLREVRSRRPWPGLDDKILTPWNGLMIGALAKAGEVFQEPRYLQASRRAAGFLTTEMWPDDLLLHSFRETPSKVPAFLDGYAFLAAGLLDLHQASGDRSWLLKSRKLADRMLELFWDSEVGGFFFTSPQHEDLLARSKDPLDRAIPSGNGIAAQVLVRLHELTGEARYLERAQKTLVAALPLIKIAPGNTQSLGLALQWLHRLESKMPASSQGKATVAEVRQAPVTLQLVASPQPTTPEQAVELRLRVRLDPNWHVNSHQPDREELVASRLELLGVEGFLFEVSYPPDQVLEVPYSPSPLRVWSEEVEILAKVRSRSGWTPEGEPLKLELTLQPCNLKSCLPPMTLGLPVSIRLASE